MESEREKLAKTVRIILIVFAGFIALLFIAMAVTGINIYLAS